MNDDSDSLAVSNTVPSAIDDKMLEFIEEAEQQRSYLKWVAARVTAGTEEAEDIVQQALLKAFVNLSRFRGDARMRTWLHTIVLNTAREHLRNQRRRVPLNQDGGFGSEDEDTQRDLPHPGISPEDLCARNEIGAILHAEIDTLTPYCRNAIEKCVIQELPYRQAARELNTNIATLKSRVYRAKTLLKRSMDMHNVAQYHSPGNRTEAGSHAPNTGT